MSCESLHAYFLTQSSLITMHAGGSGVRLYDGPDLKLLILVGWGRGFLSFAWHTGVYRYLHRQVTF